MKFRVSDIVYDFKIALYEEPKNIYLKGEIYDLLDVSDPFREIKKNYKIDRA